MSSVMWSRDTKWRQGSVLPELVSVSLGLFEGDSIKQVAMVISHDCDIVEDNLENEPNVEVIVAEVIQEAHGNHTYAKSPNKLHLPISIDGEARFLEMRAARKHFVAKVSLAAGKPDYRFALDARGLEVLRSWLAIRYKRAAFPDTLNSHLSLLRDTLQKIGKRSPEAIVGFYIYYEPDEEISTEGDLYEVWIAVVYDHQRLGSREVAEQAAAKISDKVKERFCTESGWRKLELRECEVVSDEEFSLYDVMTYKNYPLEYISLRSI